MATRRLPFEPPPVINVLVPDREPDYNSGTGSFYWKERYLTYGGKVEQLYVDRNNMLCYESKLQGLVAFLPAIQHMYQEWLVNNIMMEE